MPKNQKITLKRLFVGMQRQMTEGLKANRQNIQHPGTKGDASELNWLAMLQKQLPFRYQAEKAFVLDSKGNLSEQIDIVIFDRHHSPLLFNQNGVIYVPAESVYAIFEVKQSLNKNQIEYAGHKTRSVRNLHRTSAEIPHAGGKYPPKQQFTILAGILTYDSDWKPGLGNSLEEALCSLPPTDQLDLGCSLQHGSFEVIYQNSQPPKLETCTKNTALVFFFMRLLHRLQQLATVPAIDLREYMGKL